MASVPESEPAFNIGAPDLSLVEPSASDLVTGVCPATGQECVLDRRVYEMHSAANTMEDPFQKNFALKGCSLLASVLREARMANPGQPETGDCDGEVVYEDGEISARCPHKKAIEIQSAAREIGKIFNLKGGRGISVEERKN